MVNARHSKKRPLSWPQVTTEKYRTPELQKQIRNSDRNYVNLPVRDLKKSIDFFTRVGFFNHPVHGDTANLHDSGGDIA